MESKKMTLESCRQRLDVDEKKFNKIISTLKHRRTTEDWIRNQVSSTGNIITWISLEGVLWIEQVYFRDGGYYLDAEIMFELQQINRLENELSHSHKIFQFQDSTVPELSQVFGVSRSSIMSKIGLMESLGYSHYKYTKSGIMYITSKGVEWMATKYKDYYFKCLNDYKHILQKEKRYRNVQEPKPKNQDYFNRE